MFPLEHSCLTLLPVFPVGTRSLLASLSHPVPSSSDTMTLVCEGPAFSFISEHPLGKAPLQFSEDAYLNTRSTGSSAPQERSGWRCSGPKVLLSWPWALPSGVSQGLGMRGPPPASHAAPVTSDDWQPLPVSLYDLRAASPSSLE